MPSHNLSNDHYTQAEMEQARSLMAQVRDLIKPRTRNLLPDERQRYGSIREQTKLLVQKDLSYHEHSCTSTATMWTGRNWRRIMTTAHFWKC